MSATQLLRLPLFPALTVALTMFAAVPVATAEEVAKATGDKKLTAEERMKALEDQ